MRKELMKCQFALSLAAVALVGALPAPHVEASDIPPGSPNTHRLLRQRMLHPAHSAAIGMPSSPKTSSSSAPPNFTFFDMPSSTNTEATGINLGVGGGAPQIVGCYVPNNSTSGNYNGFEYSLKTHGSKSTATFDVIGPTGVGLCPFAINDSGTIVGLITPNSTESGIFPAFILDGGTVTQLNAPYPNTCVTFAKGVNDTGTVIGEYEMNASCTADDGWSEAGFIWSNGTFTQVPDYPDSIDSQPTAINSAGDIVGGALNAAETADFGWLLQGGVFTPINYPGSVFTWPQGINDAGEIVGYYCAASFADCQDAGPYLGFLYKNGTFTTISVPGVPGTYLYGINNKGEISGEYEDTNGYWHSFLVTR